ncbi:3-hydroxyacyl-CoA dehydrogenase family protein [Cyclobacterium amurskyense]|uniref:3-hydroxybutyryl-coA dehydrogenase n=1 Tax=Cyclobacterium amurskyense TaxID=320787 RepID=A0A0H4PMU9_9BACT|nr:3-hydroxyacyl-CoA dehydrogenase family protein [Cyclobacterium amurskyense]AKP49587.1 3-hydroxybutyryl-coA dehydrogenase [Cyclobacterium amurskyense]
MNGKNNSSTFEIGVVGLGLMGTSIIVSLLVSGHPVIGIAPLPSDMDGALDRIQSQMNHADEAGLLSENVDYYLKRLHLTEDYSKLKSCSLVQECVTEVIEIKTEVYLKISQNTESTAVIATNTSAIPISVLQENVNLPSRFIGIHWAEPAYMTRFLEVTKGALTDEKIANRVLSLARTWNKEPTYLKKDLRGFVTNRMLYAVYREMFAILENGEASMDDLDKAFRYDPGSWMTYMGLFKRMDQLGLSDFKEIFENIFPQLDNSQTVPTTMQAVVKVQGKGINNGKGLYNYTKEEAIKWEEAFKDFNHEIFHLAAQYPEINT